MAKQQPELAARAVARARFVRISPFKVRQVAALIRNKPVDEARRILAFTPKAASYELSKVLEAAVANAEHNHQIPQDELVVRIARADEGPTIRRFRPRALGRAYRIRKRTSHIHLEVERQPAPEPQAPAERRGRLASKAQRIRSGRRAAGESTGRARRRLAGRVLGGEARVPKGGGRGEGS